MTKIEIEYEELLDIVERACARAETFTWLPSEGLEPDHWQKVSAKYRALANSCSFSRRRHEDLYI